MDSSTSSIARSLTTRINRKISVTDGSGSGLMSRAFSTRKPQERVPYRPDISLPLELLSATNPLAFNAPDLPQKNLGAAPSSSSNNIKLPISPAQTLASTASSSSLRSENSVPGLSTTSSVTSPSPLQTPVNETVDHDFANPEKRLTTLPEASVEASIAARLEEAPVVGSEPAQDDDQIALDAPVVPKRAPSHTKKTHQAFARQRSLSRIGARSTSTGSRNVSGQVTPETRKSSSSAHSSGHSSTHSLDKDANGVKVVRNSIDIFSSGTHQDVPKDHPFGAELAQLNEVAEEFSPTKPKHDDDAKEDTKQSLRRERSFKALRRGLSRKEKKQEPEKKAESETEAEPTNSLQRQRSFKVLRRDPGTKELKKDDSDTEAEPASTLQRQRSFKVLRRDPSTKEFKKDDSDTEAEPASTLQRQRSFKVLRRDPSTKELKPAGANGVPTLEKAEQPTQEQIPVPRRDPSRRRAPTVTRDGAPSTSTPSTPSKARSMSRSRQQQSKPAKVVVPPSEPTIWDEESAYLNKHGLKTFTAEDYMAEIGSPFASTFSSSQSGWL